MSTVQSLCWFVMGIDENSSRQNVETSMTRSSKTLQIETTDPLEDSTREPWPCFLIALHGESERGAQCLVCV